MAFEIFLDALSEQLLKLQEEQKENLEQLFETPVQNQVGYQDNLLRLHCILWILTRFLLELHIPSLAFVINTSAANKFFCRIFSAVQNYSAIRVGWALTAPPWQVSCFGVESM